MKKSQSHTYHHGDLRNALVDEGVRLIEKEGLDTFSLREVARRVGVSPNAAYRHFEDKDALRCAVADCALGLLAQHMQREMNQVTARGAGPRALAHLKATGRAYVHFALDRPELFRVAFSRGPVTHEKMGEALGEQPSPYTLLASCLDAMVEAGVLARERRPGAELKAWTVVHGYASLALGGGLLTDVALLEPVLDFVVDGLRG